MAKASEILGLNKYNSLILQGKATGKSNEEIKSLIQAEAKAQLQSQTSQQTQQQNSIANQNKDEAFKDTVFMDDGFLGSALRAGSYNANRLTALADQVSEWAGFDLVSDKVTNNMNRMNELYEQKKQETSRKGLDQERLDELKQLEKESQEAEGFKENAVAGVKSIWDTLTHPTEWTAQGVAELVTPENVISLGLGAVASKLGRTMMQKGLIGAGAGATEGAIVNSALEYTVAKGQNKSDEEATKIAQQSIGGGALMGAGFGAVGGLSAGYIEKMKSIKDEPKPDLSDASIEDIFENDLLKDYAEAEPLTPEQGVKGYPEVPSEYSKETVVEYGDIHPEKRAKQDFIIGSTQNLPMSLDNLVEVELLEPDQAKQIAYDHKLRLEHFAGEALSQRRSQIETDVIYAEFDRIQQSLKQEIKDAMVGREIHKHKRVEEIARSFIPEQKLLTQQLNEQGATLPEIKEAINQKFIPTPDEQSVSFFLNDGLPLENRFAGFRLIELAKNTIETSKEIPVEPKALKQKLQSGGVSDQLSNKVVESVINKNVEILEDHVADKLSEKTKQSVEQVEKQVDEVIKDSMDNIDFESLGYEDVRSASDEIVSYGGLKIGEKTRDRKGKESTFVGKNEDGEDIYQDNSGVRSHTESKGRISVTQKVGIAPDGIEFDGVESLYKNLDTEFLTKEELESFKKDDIIRKGEKDEKANTRTDNTRDREELPTGRKNGDSGVDNQSGADTTKEQKQTRQAQSNEDGGAVSDGVGYDADGNNPDDGVSIGSNKVERLKTSSSTTGDDARTRSDKVVSDETISSNGDQANYSLKDKEPVELTKGKRKEVNSKVDEILKKPVEQITEKDKDTLRQYTGKGGLEHSQNSLTEHYTPYETIKSIYNVLDNLEDFKPKKALEPSVGSGNFVGFKPNLDWTTVDIDKTNHEVVKRLYPKGKHYNISYEAFKGKDFDLIISNVPFLEVRGEGRNISRPDIKALHDYYFVESLNKVNDNGIVAFITSTGVMDKIDSTIRSEIVSKADIIGAYRLPAKTFSKNAHTDVTTDIIFMQKRPDGVESRLTTDNEAFIKSNKTKDGVALNKYYELYPMRILGDMKLGKDKMYGGRPKYEITGEPDYTRIQLDYIPYKQEKESKQNKRISDYPTESKEFYEYAVKNDLVYESKDSPNIILDDSGFRVATKTIDFEDIEGGAKIYTPIKGKIRQQINLLERIRSEKEAGAVSEYKAKYKIHPESDKGLKKFFRDNGEIDMLQEWGALFDKDFNVADSFKTQTQYTGSGKLEVTSKSKLHDRLLYNESVKGDIDLNNAKYFDKSELIEALDSGYAYVDENSIQNDILYYGGNVYSKLDKAKFVHENLPDGALKDRVEKQIANLEDKIPTKKSVDEIDFKGTESWLKEAGIKLFDYEIKETERKVPGGEGTRKERKIKSKMGALYDKFLNQEALIKAKEGESQSQYKRRLKEAQHEIKQKQTELKEYIKRNPDLKAKFEDAYNRKFNFYVRPEYKKAQYLIQDVLDELPKGIKLRENQINWVIKALYEGKGINAHDVGGGKTMAGITLGRVLKKKGIAKKPLYVVPSKVIKNWEKEIKELFPDAKIISLGGLPARTRSKRLFELSNTNADYVLISQEGFKELKLPGDIEQRYAHKLLSENMRNEDLSGRARNVQEKKIRQYLDIISKQNADKRITIDKLGIDAIIADEARAFKNVGVNSKLVSNKLGKAFGVNVRVDDATKEIKGVALDSAMAYDFRFKTKYISSLNNGNNIYLLDATPTPNKPIEVFTMLKHLDDNIFDEYNIRSDRDFAEMFFDFGQKQDKSGKFGNGLIALKNAIPLNSILDRFVDRIPMKEFEKKGYIKNLPKENIVKQMISMSDESNIVFDKIRELLKEAKNDSQLRHKIMGIFSDGVNASVDPRLYNKMEIDGLLDPTPENSKIERVVELVSKRRSENKEAGQIIFVDKAGHQSKNLVENLHREIKQKLLKQGYKKEEVAIISGQEITDLSGVEKKASGEKGSKMKQDIVNAYNSGKIKVVIGTTQSAGEGMNIQKYTTDIYHLDLPWTPGQIIQRNGRGIRAGNINSKVDIHYFFQEGTFDSLMYSTVMGKKGWNDAIWDSDVKDRIEILDDDGSAMPSEAEILIEMESDPVEKQKMIIRFDHEKLEAEYEAVQDELNFTKAKLISAKEALSSHKEKIEFDKKQMQDDTPTKALRDAFEKAYRKSDKQKEYKAKYEADLKRWREKKGEYIKQKEAKEPQIKKMIDDLQKEYSITTKAFDEAREKLLDYESKHLDDRGNPILQLDKEGC
jgi:hypothetical protein